MSPSTHKPDLLVRRVEELECENLGLRQFAWAASHDLKEPLRGVVLHLELLAKSLEGKLEANQAEHLKFALKGAQLMTSVLPAVEQYIRIQTEKVEWAPVDCGAVAGNVVLMLRSAIVEAGGSVTWANLPCVHANESLLTHVFLNLIDNAIRYRSQEPPKIKIGCEREDGKWSFSVTDNGKGIDGKYLEYVFEPFGRFELAPNLGIGDRAGVVPRGGASTGW